ncbi:MAG: hypothetical protein P1U42_03530 [Phycisphaerales bacterium]|nr:hypothetical protein [Phycisphaerales bacterium]
MHSLTLSQSIDPKLWMYFVILLAVIFVGGIAIFAIRRALFSQDQSSSNQTGGGLLEHLDEMKRNGQITNEEYEITRKSIIQEASRNMSEEPTSDPDNS